jgi:hypothetical protein
MTRRGKIARLPHELREELNRRLNDGERGKPLVTWLNGLPAVRAVLAREFAGKPIREQNLSEWRQGGYRDWLAEETAIIEVREIAAAAQSAGSGPRMGLNDRLGTWVAVKYAMVAAHDNAAVPDRKRLREMCDDVTKLRREDHAAMRLRLEAERLKQAQK